MKLTTNRVLTCLNLRLVALCAGLALAATLPLAAATGPALGENALLQIEALRAEKEARTPAQQKIDSQIIYALKQSLNQPIAAGVTNLRVRVQREADGRAWVDLKATITPDLLAFIRANGGTVLNSHSQYGAARVLIPLTLAEPLGARSDVRFVRSAVPYKLRTGSVDSEGDTTHNAISARLAFDTTGAGAKVGVISDSVDFLTQAQATGDLGDVIVLTGQSGIPGTGEGTAMLEIVHDLAPDAQLFFATGGGSEANFAANIVNLRLAGCDIIVDDIGYLDESPFQDGIVAQAVNTVTADGAFYFSAAGNEGNEVHGTSGTWEGDFADGGAVGGPVNGKGGRYHLFGTNTFNTVTGVGSAVALYWSDPIGGSANDYDLYVVDSTGNNLVSSSTTVQNGTQDPFEICPPATNGSRIVVVRASGAARFLHVATWGGQLELSTPGSLVGHAAATNAFAVGAVDIHTAYPNAFIGGPANPVESFSSDGPRQVFYQADGTPITFGNFLSGGGALRAKPEFCAADGVSTTLSPFSGLNPFFGTSAAAPHAAAIAALVKAYAPAITQAQMRTVLTGSTLDNEAPGYDYDSGFGILMADLALNHAPKPAPVPKFVIVTNTISGGNGNGVIDYNECNSMNVVLENVGRAGASGIRVSIASATPKVTVGQPNSPYLDMATNALGTNLVPFTISTAPDFVCGTTILLTVQIKCDQNTSTNLITLTSGAPGQLCVDGGGECPGSDMALGMIATPEPVILGNYLVYTISVTNRGPSRVSAAAVSQVLPDNVLFISATPSQGSWALKGNVLTLSLGPMASGGTATITVAVLPTIAGSLISTASASSDQPDPDPSNNSATVFSHANPPTADLAVGLVPYPSILLVGGNVTYTVSVTNNGPSAASGVTVTNQFPPGLLLTGETISQGSLAAQGNTIICSFGILANGAHASATITAIPVTNGTMVATAVLNANPSQFDPVLLNNSASAMIAVSPAADIAVGIAGLPNPVVLSSNLTMVTAITNFGPSTATGITLSQTLPVGVNVLSVTVSQGSYSRTTTNLSCSLGSLNPGARATVSIVMTTTKLGFLSSSCSVNANENDSNLNNNTASTQVSVGLPFVSINSAGASLTAENFSPPDGSLEPGETVTVQFRLQNLGNVVNTNLVATLLPTGGVTSPSGPRTYGILKPMGLPGGVPVSQPFTFTASGTNGGTVVVTLQLQDGANTLPAVTYSFALPTQASYSNSSLMLIPNATNRDAGRGVADPYPSTITVSGWSGQVGKLTATLVGLTHTDPHDLNVLLVGPTGAKTLLLSHAGGGAMISNVTFVLDDAAASPIYEFDGITPGTWQPSVWASPVFSNPAPAGPYSSALATFSGLNPNGPWSLYVLDDSTGDIGAISNGWSLNLTGVTPINQVVDLALSAAVTNAVFAGDTLTYVFSVTNAGPAAANGVTFSNALPPNVVLLSATASQGNVLTNGGVVVGNLASLNVGASATVTIMVMPTVAAAGALSSSASVATQEADIHSANNVVSALTTVAIPAADITCSLAASATSVVVASNLTYSIAITNNGPGNALNVIVNDPLPAGVTCLAAMASQGSVVTNGGAITASLGVLAPGASASVTLAVAAAVPGLITNSVTAATDSSDTVPANNWASVVVQAVSPAPNITPAGASLVSESFSPPNGAIDPGETVTLSLILTNGGTLDTANLVATLLSTGGVSSPSGPALYGQVIHGGPTASRHFTFTAGTPVNGSILATLQLQDGAINLGNVTFTFGLKATNSFNNTAAIIIPDHGVASPYPSVINVSGLSGYVQSASVSLNGLAHSFPSDVNVLLVNPAGAKAVLMSHAGGAYGVTNLVLSFVDAATNVLPQNTRMLSSTNKLSQYGGAVNWAAPAPAAPYGTNLATLAGVDPNGAWQLYVLDDSRGDGGSIVTGWSLNLATITPIGALADLGIGMVGSPGALYLGSTVAYTLSVTNFGPAAAPGVTVTDTLPAGFSVLSNSPSQGSASVSGSVVTWTAGRVDTGAVATLVLQTAPSLPGLVFNTATVSGDYTDLTAANNTVQVATSVSSPVPAILSADFTNGLLELTISANPGQTYDIRASTNLTSWVSLGLYTAPVNGIISVTDTNSTSYQDRYYRTIRQTP